MKQREPLISQILRLHTLVTSCSRCAGISYYGGIIGSIVKGNNIHHLLKGFYSKAMGAMIVENNTFHDNYLYGIDPPTGTHDMIIRNNNDSFISSE